MEISLSGRVAIVTGGSKRIGRRIVIELATAGAAVVVNSRTSLSEAQEVVATVEATGGRAIACLADVTVPADATRLVECAIEHFGCLDILVNNAAIRPNHPLLELDFAEWRNVLAVILDGSFLCARAAAPYIKGRPQGRIINIGGTSAHRGVTNRIHVMTAKSGLVGLTKGLALELAPHATANCVVPGLIEDAQDNVKDLASRRKRMSPDLVPVGRTGSPLDIAALVCYLSSDLGGYITGQTLHVSGGLYFP